MQRATRVEYPGAIYHVMDRGDRREDISIFAGQVDCGAGANCTAKGAKSVLHRSGRGQHQHKPARADEPCAQLEFQSTVWNPTRGSGRVKLPIVAHSSSHFGSGQEFKGAGGRG